MALRPPGSSSNVDFLIYGSIMVLQLIVFIGGHAVIGYLLLGQFGIGKGMPAVVEFTGLPGFALWLLMLATIAMDIWVVYHKRLERKKNLER